MNSIYVCPKCKQVLSESEDTLSCDDCKVNYRIYDGYVDFIPSVDFYAGEISKKEITELISEIDILGFSKALDNFFLKFPHLQSYLTDVRRCDFIYHGIGSKKSRCLDVGSGLGNISERAAQIFDEVYSVEGVPERIEFQKRRFKYNNINNITISRCNVLSLPFKDDFFDLIICNGVLEWIGMMNSSINPRDSQILFLKELKRILSKDGRIYIGIENRTGLPLLMGEKDHSGLPFTSLMPRTLASFIVNRFGIFGGVYGDKSLDTNKKGGYFTYTYTYWGYQSLFKSIGIQPCSFWAIPSYNQPYFSGSLKNAISLRCFLNYLKKMQSSSKQSYLRGITIAVASLLPNIVILFLIRLLSPSFLFFCAKTSSSLSLTESGLRQMALKDLVMISEGSTIKLLLCDNKGVMVKLGYLRRNIKNIPDKILHHDKTNPKDIPKESESIWFNDWIEGKVLDPTNFSQMEMAIQWLIKFQSKFIHSQENNYNRPILEVKKDLLRIPELGESRLLEIIGNYDNFVRKNNLRTCPEHGDYWAGNILISHNNVIRVIDWEKFNEFGDPLFDFIFLIITTRLNVDSKSDMILSDIYKDPNVVKYKEIFEDHLKINIHLDIVVPYVLLRCISERKADRGIQEKEWMKYYKLLANLTT